MKAPTQNNYKPQTEIIEEGLHHAIIYAIVDMWSQETKNFTTWKKELKRNVRIAFEFPEIVEDYGKWPQPAWLFFTKSFSMHEKAALRQAIESMTGKKLSDQEAKDFDLSSLLWLNCNILAKHNGDYVNISDFTKYKGEPKLPQNDSYVFSLDNFNENIFKKIGEKTQEKIKQTPEYAKATEILPDYVEPMPF